MVVVSHDREFLDQLCTKTIETERGVATTYPGNYTQYVNAKVREYLCVLSTIDLYIPYRFT